MYFFVKKMFFFYNFDILILIGTSKRIIALILCFLKEKNPLIRLPKMVPRKRLRCKCSSKSFKLQRGNLCLFIR